MTLWQSFQPVVRDWFVDRFEQPTPAQAEAWPRIKARQNVLIAAPTGSGKTLSAFLSCIDDLVAQSLSGALQQGTQVLYVSPLKALSNDIHNNLEAPLTGISERLEAAGKLHTPVTAAVRTGDTPQGQREKMRRRPPHILVTTPESLFILLTSVSGRQMLSGVRTVIIDEIHAMAGSKRGAHLLLSLARLDALCGQPPLRIGLSATQKPITAMARFLCHTRPCAIVDAGHQRERDLALAVPGSPLSAILSNEVWVEIYDQLAELVAQHQTTLIFVNTRRLAERATRHLAERLGEEAVMAHHGSLAREHRLEAEQRLKAGSLKAMVATASLELGIDIGDVDLVCQLGSPRSIAAFLQRVGRSGHAVGQTPKGRLFPLSLDDLSECVALLSAVREDQLDHIRFPTQPLDVLAQHVVAEVAGREWNADALFEVLGNTASYASLSRQEFEQVLVMLADGFSTRRGRRSAYLHYDRVNGELRARRGARLAALTNAGTIPDQFDYEVVLRPADLRIGSLNEDFAFESLPGDIFQLGNASYRILKVETGRVFVEDANGLPPTIPFWFGEAPGRTDELSLAVSQLRERANALLSGGGQSAFRQWLEQALGCAPVVASQLAQHLGLAHAALEGLPTHDRLVLERFFDDVGDMHLVIHSTWGSRINRALGLALRKRFCRKFNFELQASALEDSLILSLGPTHSFAMDEVMGYLKSASVREVLVQALLDAPMFPTHWRWNASIALAVRRMNGGKKRPPQFQRSDAEDLMAVVFPDQLACAENLAGSREVPDHPLVRQTIDDCLTDLMDIEGLERLLAAVEAGTIDVACRELVHPSPLSESVINAKPYAFLDDGDAENRRTRAVSTRSDLTTAEAATLGRIDPAAIERLGQELALAPRDADETHDALMICGLLSAAELTSAAADRWLAVLAERGRAVSLRSQDALLWVARERWHEAMAAFGLDGDQGTAPLAPPPDSQEALVSLLRSRLEMAAPVSLQDLASTLGLAAQDLSLAMLQLENEGWAVRGAFLGEGEQWCSRRLLARLHKYSISRRRQAIRPVDLACFQRFLLGWHGLAEPDGRGRSALDRLLDRLEGASVPVSELEKSVLPARMESYRPDWLDDLCRSGEVTWLRLKPPAEGGGKDLVAATPLALVRRRSLRFWLASDEASPWTAATEGAAAGDVQPALSSSAARVFEIIQSRGASFADELREHSRLLDPQLESALAELINHGLVTADSFQGARYLAASERQRLRRKRYRDRGLPVAGLDEAGRWSALTRRVDEGEARWERVDYIAQALLKRYGVVFRALIAGQVGLPPWRDLLYVMRRQEAREEIAGGRFVDGFAGEQFALPEVVSELRRQRDRHQGLVVIAAVDPLNLTGRDGFPGPRIAAVSGNLLAFVDGCLAGALVRGELVTVDESLMSPQVRDALSRGPRNNIPLRPVAGASRSRPFK